MNLASLAVVCIILGILYGGLAAPTVRGVKAQFPAAAE
jgi:hypothetical protein